MCGILFNYFFIETGIIWLFKLCASGTSQSFAIAPIVFLHKSIDTHADAAFLQIPF